MKSMKQILVIKVSENAAGKIEYDNEILSKFNKRKIAREDAENARSQMNSMKVSCCAKC